MSGRPGIAQWLPVAVAAVLWAGTALGQTFNLTGPTQVTGTVRSVVGNRITIEAADGSTASHLIQPPDERAVSMGGRLVSFPATITVRGRTPIAKLAVGSTVRFEATVDRSGRVLGPIGEVTIVDDPKAVAGVEKLAAAKEGSTASRCRVTGRLERVRDGRITVDFGRNEAVPTKTKLIFPAPDGAEAVLESQTLRHIVPGAAVTEAEIFATDDGTTFVRTIVVELPSGAGGGAKTLGDALNDKYRNLSTEPTKPRDVRSAHFLLRTDVSERDAQILLEKLERMFVVVSGYLGAAPTGPILCYVVQDEAQWPAEAFDPRGLVKIKNKEGVTVSRSLGSRRESVVYSFHDHGVVQHEAVHALCWMALGDTGPVWFAEGFAELGYHWDPDDPAVDLDPVQINLFKTTPVKGLLEITAPGQVTGDSWQNYAWRWALCHLLSNSPNYAPRFRAMAVGLMREEPGVSFESVYGDVAREIEFEYRQFIAMLEPGLRVDLTAWDWRARFRPVSASKTFETVTVAAGRGWQPTGLTVEAGKAYDVAAKGEWTLHRTAAALSPDGTPAGAGRLVAAVLTTDERGAYHLSDEIELGIRATLTPTAAGRLYFRCRDEWAALGDNSGSVTVYVRPAGQAAPAAAAPQP